MPERYLIVCPLAVGSAWERQIQLASSSDIKLWDHQIDISGLIERRSSLLVAAGMGTGKSIATLSGLGLMGDDLLRVMNLTASRESTARKASRLTEALADGSPLLAIVHFDVIWRKPLADLLKTTRWSAVVIDESQRIKSPASKCSRAALAIGSVARKRICLSGTPMPKSPLDLFGQLRFLGVKELPSSFARFRDSIADCHHMFPSKVIRWKNQHIVKGLLRDHAFMVESDDVLDLPEYLHTSIPIDIGSKARAFYQSMKDDLVAEIEAGVVTAANAAVRTIRLRQATSGFAALDNTPPEHIAGTPAKAQALESMISDLPQHEPVVVFAEFRADLDEIRAATLRLGRGYAEVSGMRPADAATLEQWQAGAASVIGVQTRAGAEGIDLTRAAYGFYYSAPWSLGTFDQSVRRLVRPGQTRCVRFYHLVASGSVDEVVYRSLQQKRAVIDSVLEGLKSTYSGRNADVA